MRRAKPAVGPDGEPLSPREATTLLRTNETLREDVRRLTRDVADLRSQLAAALADSRNDRAARRAALNLLEDAENARAAEVRANAEQRRVEDELRQANRRKDEFLATLAHELRNPLAPIRNSLHILRMAGADGGAVERVHTMLERQV